MKYILILFSLHILVSCTNSKQRDEGELTIDKNLANRFFEELNYGVHGPGINEFNVEFISNADLMDLNHKHYSFDTCRSFFLGNTLIIEFRSITFFLKDKIRLEIRKKYYKGYFIKGSSNKEYVGVPKSLKFKTKINKKGQEILGELAIEFSVPELNLIYSFQGPFKCIVE